jgi:hypothetical protein
VALLGFAAAAAGIGVPATPGQHAAVDETQYLLTALSIAEDGDLDIADELATQRWRDFADAEPPVQTATRADGRAISPHDPLLPLLLAVPVALGGWVGAKLTLAACAGLLAALTLWTAVRRFAVPAGLAATGVAVAAGSAPLAVYGQQVYPELPAALGVVAGVVALTGPADRRHVPLLVIVLATVPWLSVKYVPVLAALAAVGAYRWRRRPRDLGLAAAVLAGVGAGYLAVHRTVWGGWTVYASGDHFAERGGEFAVVGDEVSVGGRAARLVGLLVDRDYGLAAWQPAWLLVVVAAAALLAGPGVTHRRLRAAAVRDSVGWAPRTGGAEAGGPGVAVLLVPLATGWLVASFVAATMHGYWWPGRHIVAVLPPAVLAVLVWLARTRRPARLVALVTGLVGVTVYAGLLVLGARSGFTWVLGSDVAVAPWRALLPDYRGAFLALHVVWCVVLCGSAGIGMRRLTRNGD